MTKDSAVIVEVVTDAYRRRVSLAQAALDRIASNRASLRVWRKREMRGAAFEAMRERACHRLLIDNRRTRRLIATYASWRGVEAERDALLTQAGERKAS
jgi:hypothetical protein